MLSIITGRRSFRNLLVPGLLLAGLAAGVACDKVPLLAPNLSTIALTSNSSVVQANGVAQIRATVIESAGTPVQNGTTVTFTTNLGAITPADARTVNGVATAEFTPNGQSGVAEIRAVSGAAKPADTANPSLKITVGGAATGRIQLTANPNSVPASGGSSTITATVFDTNGNALAGVPVAFSSDAGTLSSTVATTSSLGSAQVTLNTSKDTTVTATAGGSGTTAAQTATVKVTATTLPSLTIRTDTTSPAEDLPTLFTITAGAAAQDSFQSVTVDFGDGNSKQLGALSAGSSLQTFNTYRSDGAYTVKVTGIGTSGGQQTTQTVVVVSARAPVNTTVATTTASPFHVGVPVGFSVSVPSGSSIANVVWNFGDGSPSTAPLSGTTTSHNYSVAGTYIVTATVTTTDANTGTGQIQVVINP